MQDNEYQYYVVQSYHHTTGGSRHSIRAKPLPGQGIETTAKVECSSTMRNSHPVGTLFRIRAKITDREGGTPFLYTSHTWPYTVVSAHEAETIIANQK